MAQGPRGEVAELAGEDPQRGDPERGQHVGPEPGAARIGPVRGQPRLGGVQAPERLVLGQDWGHRQGEGRGRWWGGGFVEHAINPGHPVYRQTT
jgi:hypothetical protein